MKTNFILTLLLISGAAVLNSCSKSSDTAVDVPNDATITLSAAEVYPYSFADVWGVFHAVRTERMYGTGTKPPYIFDGGEVCLLDEKGRYKQVGGVTLNPSTGLGLKSNTNVYVYGVDSSTGFWPSSYFPPSTKLPDFETGVTWSVYNGDYNVELQYTDNNALPYINRSAVYSYLPITDTTPLTLNLYADNFANVDSVYVILPTYVPTPGKAYSVSAGTITFTRSDLAGSSPIGYSKGLVLTAYRTQKVEINGRVYVFVREYRCVAYVFVSYK